MRVVESFERALPSGRQTDLGLYDLSYCAGYSHAHMDLFMDWHPIERDDVEMRDLARHACEGRARVLWNLHGNVVSAQQRCRSAH